MNGGYRPGSGRKSKAEELKLIEKLSPLEESAFDALKKGVKKGEFAFLKMYFEYYFGKPTENIDHSGGMDNKLIIEHIGRQDEGGQAIRPEPEGV